MVKDKSKSKFLLVKCIKCGNEQTVFGSSASKVACLVCGDILVNPSSSKSKITSKILKVLQ